jgi:hypothetical protein
MIHALTGSRRIALIKRFADAASRGRRPLANLKLGTRGGNENRPRRKWRNESTLPQSRFRRHLNPLTRVADRAITRVTERHRPFLEGISRRQPTSRVLRVKAVQRLPRPMNNDQVDALLGELRSLRDRALVHLMLDGGLRPGEALARSSVPNASSCILLAIIRRSRSAVRSCGTGWANTACQRRRSAGSRRSPNRRLKRLRELAQRCGDARDYGLPLPRIVLAEKARARIPGTIAAIEQPAPTGIEAVEQPERFAERASEMSDRGVDRDD